MRCIVGVLLLLAAVSAIRLSAKESLGEDRVFRLFQGRLAADSEEADMARAILAELDDWGHSEDGGLEVRASRSDGKKLAQLGLNVTDVTDFHLSMFEWFDANNQLKSAGEACDKGPAFFDNYQRLECIHERVDDIIAESKGLATSYSWGTTTEGRDMKGLKIASHSEETDKRAIFYFCGEHAREWLPPMFCMWLAEQLTTQATTDSRVAKVIEKYDVYILPVMNCDGYVFSMTENRMWRKSRKLNPGTTCVGTDLNRNYYYRWNNGGSSSNPCSDTYHGETPFDNPETNAMRKFYESVDIVVQTDVHAYGQMWMHPWGWTRTLAPDDAKMSRSGLSTVNAIKGVNGLTFAHGSIANVIYIASGSSCDDFYGSNGVIYAYAPEVRGSSFQPPASNIRPSNDELFAGFLAQVDAIED